MGLTRTEALRILGLEDGCTNRDIRERFKKLALKWHPDKNPCDPDEAQKKFQAISAAYTRLVASEEADDEISHETLGEMFAEIWETHNRRRGYNACDPHAHLFCDCDLCHERWHGMDYRDILGSDSDQDEDLYYGYDESMYADSLLREFADRMYRNYNGPTRSAVRRTKTDPTSSWSDSVYNKKRISKEEATKNADELLKAEEDEKKLAEKRREKNKRKKEAKKRSKAKKASSAGEKGKAGKASKAKSSEGVPTKTVDDPVSECEKEEEDVNNVIESDSEEELDVNSAFFARASKKKEKLVAKSKTVPKPRSSNSDQPPSVVPRQTQEPKPSPPPAPLPSQQKRTQQKTLKPTQGLKEKLKNGEKARVAPHASPPVSQTRTSSGPVPVQNGHFMCDSGASSDSESSLEATVFNVTPNLKVNEASSYEPNIDQSKQLAGQGNRAAKEGQFQEAVRKYSEAIELYPFDHRYYGNRSFCYDYLKDYGSALRDANAALKLEPGWPKGFYRRGRALSGLKKYEEAEKAYVEVVKLDPSYKEAEDELFRIKLEQLQNMGFPADVSRAALMEYVTVQASVDAILSGAKVKPTANGHTHSPVQRRRQDKQQDKDKDYVPVFNSSGYEIPPRMVANAAPSMANVQGRALWVGNIDVTLITEDDLWDLFGEYGKIASIRMLGSRHCAFVNYTHPDAAAKAMKALQNYEISGCYLLIRYPDNPVNTKKTEDKGRNPPPAKRSGPVNGDECYFWRTTGCQFGSKCYFRHVPEHEGIDTKGSKK